MCVIGKLWTQTWHSFYLKRKNREESAFLWKTLTYFRVRKDRCVLKGRLLYNWCVKSLVLELSHLCKTHGNGVKNAGVSGVLSLSCISKGLCQALKRNVLVELWEVNLMVCREVLKGDEALATGGCTETSCCRVCGVTAEKECCFPLMQNLGWTYHHWPTFCFL